MATLDNLVVTTALPVIKRRPGRLARAAAVVRERLHPQLRRAAAHRRRTRRPARPPAGLRGGHRVVHGGLGCLRARHRSGHPDHLASGSGRRCRSDHAAVADPAGRGRPGSEASRRDRDLGRCRGAGHRSRTGGRRGRGRRSRLAVDLLAERADRPDRRAARAPLPEGVARPRPDARPARPGARRVRSAPAGLGRRAGQRCRLGFGEHRDLTDRRCAVAGRLRGLGTAGQGSVAAAAAVPVPRPSRRPTRPRSRSRSACSDRCSCWRSSSRSCRV